MPQISVILPAFNAERTIAQTIESVLAQSFDDIELVIINDGSTDGTAKVIGGFSDPRIRPFSLENGGHVAARNRGVAMAMGTYVSFIDADDLWTPDKLKVQIAVAREQRHPAIVYSYTDHIDPNGNLICHGKRTNFSGNVFIDLLVHGNFLESCSNALIPIYYLREIGGMQDWGGVSDWDLFLRLAKCNSFVCTEQLGVFYRHQPSSMSSDLKRQELSCLALLTQHIPPVHFRGFNRQRCIGNVYFYLLCHGFAMDGWERQNRLAWFWLRWVLNDPIGAARRFKLAIVLAAKILMGCAARSVNWREVNESKTGKDQEVAVGSSEP